MTFSHLLFSGEGFYPESDFKHLKTPLRPAENRQSISQNHFSSLLYSNFTSSLLGDQESKNFNFADGKDSSISGEAAPQNGYGSIDCIIYIDADSTSDGENRVQTPMKGIQTKQKVKNKISDSKESPKVIDKTTQINENRCRDCSSGRRSVERKCWPGGAGQQEPVVLGKFVVTPNPDELGNFNKAHQNSIKYIVSPKK